MNNRGILLIVPMVSFVAQAIMAQAMVAQAANSLTISKEQVVIVPAPMVHVADVVEELTFVNAGGAEETSVSVSVPQEATHLSITNGSNGAAIRTQRMGNGNWIIRRPIREHSTLSVTVSFQLPFTSPSGIGWSLNTQYAVDVAKLYLPIAGFSLSAPDLKAATETVSLSGTSFRVFTRVGILPGDSWPISVQALPTVTKTFNTMRYPLIGQSSSGWVNDLGALGNIAVILFILSLCLFGVRRGGPTEHRRVRPNQAGSGSVRTKPQTDSLYDAWTSLEMRYEDGEVSSEVYQRERRQFLERIVQQQSISTSDDDKAEDSKQ